MKILVKQAQHGDPEAFIQLMEQNRQSLVRVAKGFFRNEEDVADAVSDTILDAWEHIRELKRPEYFKTWLIRILINNCNQICRHNKKYSRQNGCRRRMRGVAWRAARNSWRCWKFSRRTAD